MASFGFDTLALVAVVGMAGPLLASLPRFVIPSVVGELAAGLVIGRTGLGIIDPGDETFSMLANIGFALVMFVVGTHVPIRDTTLRAAVPSALARAGLVCVVAAGLSVGIAAAFHTGHAPLYTVLMASSSAAVTLPIIDSLGLGGEPVLSVTAQIAIADAASIVLLPLAIQPRDAPRAALGTLAVAACAVVAFFFFRWLNRRGY
ncbi:MAG TPA: cation:proton antiporter, partial [Mycobacterium sp.]|nr:cation:proton antiporter [Mycobacterium sp.]